MSNLVVLIGSQTDSTISMCKIVADQMNFQCYTERKIEDVLLALQEKDYNALLFDLDMQGFEALKAVRLIKNLRPKLPLIAIASEVDKKLGGKIFEEGALHLIMSPPSEESIRSALSIVINREKVNVQI